MREEIEVGDWIQWPGVLGRDQGKVASVRHDAYVVQTRTGSAPSYTTVSRNGSVTRIAPPGKPSGSEKGEISGAAI